MSERRTICAFSGKRGGYGAYVPLMRLVEEAPDLELLILLGDMHASAEFGSTVDEARSDFPSSRIELIEMGTGRSDSTLARAENLSACLGAAARLFDTTRPDIVLVHGDRGEHLMVAFAALNLGIAVAHGSLLLAALHALQQQLVSEALEAPGSAREVRQQPFAVELEDADEHGIDGEQVDAADRARHQALAARPQPSGLLLGLLEHLAELARHQRAHQRRAVRVAAVADPRAREA